MLNTVSRYFLRSRVLESQSGRNTGTKIRGDMISKLISGYLFSTTASALTGMENHVRDLATCEKAPSSLVNARCVSFVWRDWQMASRIAHQKVRKLSWSISAKREWRRTNVRLSGWISELVDINVGCVTANFLLQSSKHRSEKRCAERQEWVVPSVRNQFAKNAGERGMINMHN